MKNFVTLNQKWEQDQYSPKAASTTFQNGGFISYNGAGGVVPSTPGAVICGLGQEDVQASDVDFTSTRAIAFQEVGPNVYFTIPVTLGIATSAMVGLPFDLDTPESLDVTGAGTQIEITKFISTTLVEGKVILFA